MVAWKLSMVFLGGCIAVEMTSCDTNETREIARSREA
jgi:hypothetical protein